MVTLKRLNTRVGIEHTFGNCLFEDPLYSKLKGSPDSLRNKRYMLLDHLNYCGSLDSDTLEVRPRREIRDFNEIIKDFEILSKNIGLKPSSCSKNIQNEGGGHIHLDISRIQYKVKFIKNMHIFSYNFPELTWVFNNPFDDNMVSLRNARYVTKSDITRGDLSDSKSYNITYRSGMNTIEFRLFMMHRNVEELKIHLSVAAAIYNYIDSITTRNKPLLAFDDTKSKTFTQASKRMINLFKFLGLSEEEINFIVKHKFGFMKHRFESDKYYKEKRLCC